MSYWVYVTIKCHNLKTTDFNYIDAYLLLVLGHCLNAYWSGIHGIKRKPHLSVAWNWYHFVAIAILHQPRPTDSVDIIARLQLSDTSSIPPMHGGFLLVPHMPLVQFIYHMDIVHILYIQMGACYHLIRLVRILGSLSTGLRAWSLLITHSQCKSHHLTWDSDVISQSGINSGYSHTSY